MALKSEHEVFGLYFLLCTICVKKKRVFVIVIKQRY